MTEDKQVTKLPVEHINAELKKIGRNTENAEFQIGGWQGEELMLLVSWPDGFSATVSIGPVASAMVQRTTSKCQALH